MKFNEIEFKKETEMNKVQFFDVGYDSYNAEQPIPDDVTWQNRAKREGWLAAQNAEAECRAEQRTQENTQESAKEIIQEMNKAQSDAARRCDAMVAKLQHKRWMHRLSVR